MPHEKAGGPVAAAELVLLLGGAEIKRAGLDLLLLLLRLLGGEGCRPPPPLSPAERGTAGKWKNRSSSMAFGKSQKEPFGTAVGYLIGKQEH